MPRAVNEHIRPHDDLLADSLQTAETTERGVPLLPLTSSAPTGSATATGRRATPASATCSLTRSHAPNQPVEGVAIERGHLLRALIAGQFLVDRVDCHTRVRPGRWDDGGLGARHEIFSVEPSARHGVSQTRSGEAMDEPANGHILNPTATPRLHTAAGQHPGVVNEMTMQDATARASPLGFDLRRLATTFALRPPSRTERAARTSACLIADAHGVGVIWSFCDPGQNRRSRSRRQPRPRSEHTRSDVPPTCRRPRRS
jgi:hypothetical protein